MLSGPCHTRTFSRSSHLLLCNLPLLLLDNLLLLFFYYCATYYCLLFLVTIVQPTIICFFFLLNTSHSHCTPIHCKKTPNMLFPLPFTSLSPLPFHYFKRNWSFSLPREDFHTLTCSDECGLFRDTIVFLTLMSIILCIFTKKL